MPVYAPEADLAALQTIDGLMAHYGYSPDVEPKMLRHVVERLRNAGYEVSFSGLKEALLDTLRRTRLLDQIGPRWHGRSAGIAARSP